MGLFEEILIQSKWVNKKFTHLDESQADKIEITFSVPKNHPRIEKITNYVYQNFRIENLPLEPIYQSALSHIYIIDESVNTCDFLCNYFQNNNIKPLILESTEHKTKTIEFLDNFIKEEALNQKKNNLFIIIWWWLFFNIGAYIWEKCEADIIYFPTTVLSMADSLWGKVRINHIDQAGYHKHFYKSFYEPNSVYLDDRFLEFLNEKEKKIGLVEVIKHWIFQSLELYNYLLDNRTTLLSNISQLKKAILWAADLKRVCIDVDVDENDNGSKKILRAGHDISDKIEESLDLRIPHGIAVAIGIIKQLEEENNVELLGKAKNIFHLFNIPVSLVAYKLWL